MIISALALTFKLALVSTGALILISLLLVYLNSKLSNNVKSILSSLVLLPIVLPPTVIGFYLLIFFSQENYFDLADFSGFAFTFEGLVMGSIIYSLPFVYQPIQNSINAVGYAPIELAASMGAGPVDRFFTVTLPLARGGVLTGFLLGVAHTIGEFGVVLMIGGNIPGETQVLSVLLFEYVELGDYEAAHKLSAVLLVLSFAMLFIMYRLNDSISPLGSIAASTK